jgi:hypothetical protein
MKLIVVALTKRNLEPRNMLSTTGMVLFDVLASATNKTPKIGLALGFHDRVPIAT